MPTKAQALPVVEPRVAPTGRAIVLYAVTSLELAGRRLTVDGRRMQAVRFGQVALAIAYVDPGEYAGEALERKRSDPLALTTEARMQAHLVERLARHVTVLPQRLFTVFADMAALEAAARTLHQRWNRALTRLAEKDEYSLRLFVGPHLRGSGEPYVLRVSERAMRSSRLVERRAGADAQAVAAHVRELWQACTAHAAGVRTVKTPAGRGPILSAVFLVPRSAREAFALVVSEQRVRAGRLGITYYLEGPLAPYTFSP
ncbi:MAG TPA: GvpL/GvpF family gas vesicle protein [Candidatus Acidoferrales bacterium]|nr:GvpL/GvpF family gas vesicle protein [Candidatus Acidoferrales bacterium]